MDTKHIHQICPKHKEQPFEILEILHGLSGVVLITICPYCRHEQLIFMSFQAFDDFIHPNRNQREAQNV